MLTTTMLVLSTLSDIVLFTLIGFVFFMGIRNAKPERIKSELGAHIAKINMTTGAVYICTSLLCMTMWKVFG